MKNKLFPILCTLAVCTVLAACAQSKNVTKKNTGKNNKGKYLTYVESLIQKTLPGRPETPPSVNTYHIIVWNSTELPQIFYWKDNTVWVPCNVSKAHVAKKSGGKATVYSAVRIRMEEIKKGDTLQLTEGTPADKYIIPSEIPQTANKTIFYKTAKSTWLSLPVRNYRELPDIIMP